MNLLNEFFVTMYVLHIRDSGKLLSTQFVKCDKASSPAKSYGKCAGAQKGVRRGIKGNL